ncbi:ornithine carbamoyltransferase [Acuticoccus sp. MNP-M23]|uniref:ornithine carbamoyltransferase n=1 Tax=Acuticoccus sp. MNP-M23 TaxID=3072793 RepID=UPI0028160466|nr:ornithine carbamoyltransferase [Acuticoccus sp. MNP-M23]WMS44199.1 ornithine carbamoyltransferase [Acuticoccus sp. MNP-M23]
MSEPIHFLDLASQPQGALRAILDEAHRIKGEGRKPRPRTDVLAGRTLAMVFEKPSTRTRFSFDLAMREMGGDTIVANGSEMQLGRGESMPDTARVLSRYVDAVMIRMLDHDALAEFARHAEMPVINGLTRRSHPCQIIADLITIEERLGPIEARTVAWVGDGNNMTATFLEAAGPLGFRMRIATPPELAVPDDVVEAARAAGADVFVSTDPREAVDGADVVAADCFASMGDEDEARRLKLLMPYQVNDDLMAAAAPGAVFLHCLPAHRNEEVTDAVMDGPQSAVFDEAENRIHAQKAVLAYVFGLIAVAPASDR